MTTYRKQDQISTYLQEQFNLPVEQIESMIPAFIESLAEHLGRLDAAFAAGDLIQVGKAAHTMKGALLNLGLHDCADLAYEIEKKGKKNQDDNELERLFSVLTDKIRPYLA